jgi:soluble calcium-activated nucleotidase 1
MLRGNKPSSASLTSLKKRAAPNSGNSIIRMEHELQTIPLKKSEEDSYSFSPPKSVSSFDMGKSESTAYAAHSQAGTLFSKLSYYARYNTKTFAICIGSILLLLVMIADEMSTTPHIVGGLRPGSAFAREHWGGAVHAGYFDPRDAIIDDSTFHFAVVTDLDKLSAVPGSKKPLFQATLLPGILKRDDMTKRYSITFEEPRSLVSQHNEAGRGMELSELTIYKNRLLSFDDRTGTVFEILSSSDGKTSYVVPRFVITEGDGDTDKGMKWEWATVKNNELIMGSMGKEFTNPAGEIENINNLWIAVLNERGELRREDWQDKFAFVRELVGAAPPGCK